MPPLPVHKISTSQWQVTTTGADTSVQVTVRDPQGKRIDKFDKIHTKQMHLIAIDPEHLALTAHVHPTLKAGVFSATLPSLTGAQALFDEYDPTGPLPEQIDRYAMGTPSVSDPQWDLQTRSKVVNGLRFELTQDKLMPGMTMPLTVKVTDPTTGKPAKLSTWLAAKGHMLATQALAPRLYHFHPMGMAGMPGMPGMNTPAPGPGELQFMADVNEKGNFRLFVQVMKQGDTNPTTVSFDVDAQ
jgi:hypothetical protein